MTNISINSYIKFLKNIGIYSFLQDQPNNYFDINDNKGLNKSLNSIEGIKSIEDLKSYIKNSEICNLKKAAINTVVGDGNENANIMLIGEAPGAEEDKIGKPFVGAAGILLNKMLNAIDLKREDIYITNIIPWRPPNNRTPTNDEILQCLPFVQKIIEIVKPNMILLLGATSAKAILNSNLSIAKLRGEWHEYQSINHKEKVNCLVTYHPAFLLRSPNYKKESWKDLQEFQRNFQ